MHRFTLAMLLFGTYVVAVAFLAVTLTRQAGELLHPIRCPDFAAYDAAANVLRETPELLYAPDAYISFYQRHLPQCTADGSYLGYLYPPAFALVTMPLSLANYPAAFLVWTALNLAAIALLCVLLHRLGDTRGPLGRLFASCAFALSPTMFVIFEGQVSIMLAAALAGMLLGVRRNAPLQSAACLAAILHVKPQIALPVFALLVGQRQWRTLGAALAVASVPLAVSLLLYGPQPWLGFVRNLLAVGSDRINVIGTVTDMICLRGMLTDLFGGVAADRSITAIACVAYAACLTVFAVALPRLREPRERVVLISIAIPIGLLLSPWLHLQDTLLLVPPCIVVTPMLVARHAGGWMVACYALASSLLSSHWLWRQFWGWPSPWTFRLLLVLVCGIMLWLAVDTVARRRRGAASGTPRRLADRTDAADDDGRASAC